MHIWKWPTESPVDYATAIPAHQPPPRAGDLGKRGVSSPLTGPRCLQPYSTQFHSPDGARTDSTAVLKSGICGSGWILLGVDGLTSTAEDFSLSQSSSRNAAKYSAEEMRHEATPSAEAKPSTSVRRRSSTTMSSSSKSSSPCASRRKATAQHLPTLAKAPASRAFWTPRCTAPTRGPTQCTKMCFVIPVAAFEELPLRLLQPNMNRTEPNNTLSSTRLAFNSSRPP
mmetsp:Transcript_92540/g.160798  ORF Transcript_92540/g.160798 Transcript_92540/m.160798 type:complete len:227 (-) Transcript_92540:1014-1694(-)